MTSDEDSLHRIAMIRANINIQAEYKMRLPRNLAKGSWLDGSMLYLKKRAKEELEEFFKHADPSEAGDVLNFMAMIVDYHEHSDAMQ